VHGFHTRPLQVLITDLNYNKIETEAIQFISDNVVKIYFSSAQTGYAHLTYGGSSESGSAGSAGTSGSSGSTGTSGSSGLTYASSGSSGSAGSAGSAGSSGSSGTAGTSGSSGSAGTSGSSGLSGSPPGGSINNLQYKSGTTTFGGSNDLTIDTNSTPTTLTMVGNIAVSNGNVTVNNSQVAIIDEVIALSIALG